MAEAGRRARGGAAFSRRSEYGMSRAMSVRGESRRPTGSRRPSRCSRFEDDDRFGQLRQLCSLGYRGAGCGWFASAVGFPAARSGQLCEAGGTWESAARALRRHGSPRLLVAAGDLVRGRGRALAACRRACRTRRLEEASVVAVVKLWAGRLPGGVLVGPTAADLSDDAGSIPRNRSRGGQPLASPQPSRGRTAAMLLRDGGQRISGSSLRDRWCARRQAPTWRDSTRGKTDGIGAGSARRWRRLRAWGCWRIVAMAVYIGYHRPYGPGL